MFSQLGPLFKTVFRQAESNDTRLAIPHEERYKGRRKEQEKEESSTSPDLWLDDTVVTVNALRTFLIGFLKTLPGAQDGTNFTDSDNQPLPVRPKESKRPTNTHNAKAVRAYQSVAEKTMAPIPPASPAEKDKTSNEPTADLLQSQELRDIHALIEDLELLETKGVHNLQIQKAETFIDSMKNAVRLEKSKL